VSHGTYAGVMRHNVNRTPICPPCRAAVNRYTQEWRRRNGVGSHHWPVVLPPGTASLPLFGVVVAESFRGCA